jgi:hypothetical protein
MQVQALEENAIPAFIQPTGLPAFIQPTGLSLLALMQEIEWRLRQSDALWAAPRT